jgi:hypothetical protein
MRFFSPLVPLPDLVSEIARLLPEYLPGVATGAATLTEGRSCWIRAWKDLLTVFGHRYELDVALQEEGDSSLARQLTLYWKRGDGIMAAFLSGWGDRSELEARFQRLETIKAPQKAIIYSCAKWQDAVLEQLAAALLRYPHHIEGEEYLALNTVGTEKKLAAHWIEIPHGGKLIQSDIDRLAPVAGSPYRWGIDRAREHSERVTS